MKKIQWIAIFLLIYTGKIQAQCASFISAFPYNESFESGTAFWVSGGTNNDWAWGSPSKPVINSAGAGTKCWITGGLISSFYNYGERSWVESPCFDFTSLNRPFISFLIFWETERNYDGGNFQYSLDGGSTWQNAGSSNSPNTCTDQNWFNISSIINLNNLVSNTQGWSGNTKPTSGSCSGGGGSGSWKRATHCLKNLANKPQVKFRFTFGSGTTCNDYDGLAFDDFTISNAPDFPADFTISCNGNLSYAFADNNAGCHSYWNWDFGDTASINNTSSSQNGSHVFSSGGIYNITLSTGGNCSSDTQIVKQIKLIDAVSSSTPVTCYGGSDGSASVLVQNPGTGLSFSWSNNPGLNSNINSNIPAGSYTVTIAETGSCNLSLNIQVGYGAGSNATVTLGNDTVFCKGSSLVLHPGTYRSYTWQDNSNDSIFIVDKEGIYSVTITNNSGCLASDSIVITEDCINDLLIPRSFTPNNDGLNETFNVFGSQTENYKLLIFNRWGEMIFKSEDRNQGWDGSFRGRPVQEGIYNYVVTYDISGKSLNKSGSVFLFR